MENRCSRNQVDHHRLQRLWWHLMVVSEDVKLYGSLTAEVHVLAGQS
jgi:hypothetical protein